MPQVTPSISPRQFLILWFLGLAWSALFAAAVAAYRLRKGIHLLRPHFPDALFLETWASGRSHRNVITRLGGANRCLWVAVTKDELVTGLHFPFSLFFPPGWPGLEHRLKSPNVVSVERRQSVWGRQQVLVQFRVGGHDEAIELDLKDPARFVAALEILRRAANAPEEPSST